MFLLTIGLISIIASHNNILAKLLLISDITKSQTLQDAQSDHVQ